jgi:hypothetical protein
VAFGIGGGDKLAGGIGDAGFFAAVGMEGGGGLSIASGGAPQQGAGPQAPAVAVTGFKANPRRSMSTRNEIICLVPDLTSVAVNKKADIMPGD